MTQLRTLSTQETPSVDRTSAVVRELERWFAHEFSVWDASEARLIAGTGREATSLCETPKFLSSVVATGLPAVMLEDDPLFVLAIPLSDATRRHEVAVATIANRSLTPDDRRLDLAVLLGIDPIDLDAWFAAHLHWTPAVAVRFALAFLSTRKAERRVELLESCLEDSINQLSASYDELSLLHRLTTQLKLSSSDEELGREALNWILEHVPACGAALHLHSVPDAHAATYQTRTDSVLLTAGTVEFDLDELLSYIDSVDFSYLAHPHLANIASTSATTLLTGTQQLIIAPVADREQLFGHLVLANHRQQRPFGLTNATLMGSVAAILGTHCGNYELYRQHAEFLASVVQALTSAIDAKDAYTCGHSDRVARIAVCLGQQLNCSNEELSTLYMAGLLHDIGKIGISDSVLQKPGALTSKEFAHIQKHPQLGFNILADIRQLSEVLPIVLHHHEQWNGKGYPSGLQGEQIPKLARITAVADAFDAMTSNRPYRPGMPLEKVESILKDGAGKQWDPSAVLAYFDGREDILRIMANERENLPLDLRSW